MLNLGHRAKMELGGKGRAAKELVYLELSHHSVSEVETNKRAIYFTD
jgi:hypothetical protein